VGNRHHYVPQFQLREFTDPAATGLSDPWLWIGNCADGKVKRRAPGNIGWERGLYDVSGALSGADSRLEEYLARKIEAPAAGALREFGDRPPGSRGSIPQELMLHVAWAAARTPAMRVLFQKWIDSRLDADGFVVEPPPRWFNEVTDRHRRHRMEHELYGTREDVEPDDVAELRSSGWRFALNADDFGELLHMQAHYFYDRFFPRMEWLILDAPEGEYFVIGDRPVVWGFAGALDLPPYVLRVSTAQLVAPLTRSLALAAYNPSGESPSQVRVRDLNRAMTLAAQDWIAGPTETTVVDALTNPQSGSAGRVI
jgi:hypothetical protein